jgi:hypothetical protein
MARFVVKILAAGIRRAMDSEVLASILSMQFGKFQQILKSFKISVNISSLVCMYVYIYVCMYVCMYVRTYVCMYVCTYVLYV